jgi:PAT family beta-lactamase induction signal transducer AmpG
MAESAAPLGRSWLQSLAVYRERRLIITLFLGFSSGLPLLLTAGTLSAWLSEAGVAKTVIGLMSIASAAYTFKFLWAPVVDRVAIPGLTRLLGQRRAWMLLAQGLTMIALVGLGLSGPAINFKVTVAWAVLVAFASATQDIVIDAYRIELLAKEEFGAGAAMNSLGYRLAILASGGGALILADAFGWFAAYSAMAVLMLVGVITVLSSPEPARPPEKEAKNYAAWIQQSVVAPFADFLSRPGWVVILLFIAFYKYGDALLGVMANPFYLEIGFTKTEIGLVSKTYGVAMTILGGFVGGALVARFGIMRTLLYGGIIMGATNLLYTALAHIGHSVPALIAVISIENLANGIGGVAFIAYLSSLCNLAYTATQYALMSSFMAFARTLFASGGGWLADRMDWGTYFLLTTIAAIPGILLLLWMMRRFPQKSV